MLFSIYLASVERRWIIARHSGTEMRLSFIVDPTDQIRWTSHRRETMRVRIIGETSFTGHHVVRDLSNTRHEVAIFHRGQVVISGIVLVEWGEHQK